MGCRQGNVRILTHDFVHKTHLAIFKIHYPPILMDWCPPPLPTNTHTQRVCARSHKHAGAHTHTPTCARTHVPRPRRGDSDLTRRWAGGGGHGPF